MGHKRRDLEENLMSIDRLGAKKNENITREWASLHIGDARHLK